MKTTDFIAFNKVADPFGWLSNMSNHPISFEGKIFPRAEHLFMWLRIKDEFASLKARILTTHNPIACKKMIKKAILENPKVLKHKLQSDDDIKLMELVTRLKLEQYEQFKWELLSTKDKVIIEDVTTRANFSDSSLFWGAANLWVDKPNVEAQWVGLNILGNIWQEHRKRLFNDILDNLFYTIECSNNLWFISTFYNNVLFEALSDSKIAALQNIVKQIIEHELNKYKQNGL